MPEVYTVEDSNGMKTIHVPIGRTGSMLPLEAERLAKEIIDMAKEVRAHNKAREQRISNGG